MTRLEIGGVMGVVRRMGEGAFTITHPVSNVSGGVVKRRALH